MELQKLDFGTAKPDTAYTKNLETGLDDFATKLREILNGGLLFADNHDVQIKTITTNGVAGVEGAVSHVLKKIPTGYIVCSLDKAAIIYNGSTAWTTTNIYLKSNVVTTTAVIMIF